MSGDRTTGCELDVMVVGRVPVPQAYVFRPERGNRITRLLGVIRPGAKMVDSPCLAYVVRHPSAGTILIDTGLHPDAGGDLRRDFGRVLALVFRDLRPDDVPYEEQLRRLGVEPRAVERVIMTHLHVDHTSGMRLLPNAQFVCAREEWAAATSAGAGGRGYAAHHLPPESRMELVDFEADGERRGQFSATIDLVGDGSVLLISTPGHTPGHMSVLVQLDGGEALLVGDAAYTLRTIREEVLPLLTASDELCLRSLRELKAFSEQRPETPLVPSHDPTAWHQLPRLNAATEAAPRARRGGSADPPPGGFAPPATRGRGRRRGGRRGLLPGRQATPRAFESPFWG